MSNDNNAPDNTSGPPGNDAPETLPAAERVGFGRPPEATRFKKGVSGNPKGRPKRSLNLASAFTKAMHEKVVINEHGKRKTVTKLEAALKQVVNKAASGDLRALAQLVVLAQDAETKQNTGEQEAPFVSELDQEVIEGILKRYSNANEEDQGSQNDQQPEAQEEN